MKRSASVLSSALLGAGLLSIGSANAQNAIFRLSSDTTTLTAGGTVTFSIFMTLSAASTVKSITPNIVVDSSIFIPFGGTNGTPGGTVSFRPAAGDGQFFDSNGNGQSLLQANNNQPLQAPTDINGSSVLPAGSTYLSTKSALVLGALDGSTAFPTVSGGSEFYLGNYRLRVAGNYAGASTFVGFTNAVFPAAVGAQRDEVAFTSSVNTASQANGRLTFANGGRVTFGTAATPGPESVAVFAMGGLAPALAVIRRRRAKKN